MTDLTSFEAERLRAEEVSGSQGTAWLGSRVDSQTDDQGLDTALRPTNEGASWLESYRAFYDIILKAVSGVRTSLPDWDLFRWVVVSLLAANCTLLTIVWTDVGSEIAEFKQEQDGLVKQVAEMRTAQAEAGRAQYVQDTRATNEPENAGAGPAQPISIIRPRVADEAAKAKSQAMTSGQKPMAKARH